MTHPLLIGGRATLSVTESQCQVGDAEIVGFRGRPRRPRKPRTKCSRGYAKADFEQAWASYCSDEGDTPTQPSVIKHLRRP
jgi:hypothetical protein